MIPEQICIKFQFISAQNIHHEQFAVLQSPHTSDVRMFIKVGKECKWIFKNKAKKKKCMYHAYIMYV